jgi:hypothetical protein
VYSTCSIHAIENEHVVRESLRSNEAQIGRFVLAPQKDVLPRWPRRGLSLDETGTHHSPVSLFQSDPELSCRCVFLNQVQPRRRCYEWLLRILLHQKSWTGFQQCSDTPSDTQTITPRFQYVDAVGRHSQEEETKKEEHYCGG